MNPVRFFIMALKASLFLILVVGCSSKQSPSRISFSLKDLSAASTGTQVELAILNISAPDRPGQVYEFDCLTSPCGEISVDVEPGSERLIQLLLVAKESTNEKKILYNDVSLSLGSGTEFVPLTLSEVASFHNEGIVSGRNVPTSAHSLAGRYLTGDVDVKVFVGAGKP